MRYQLLALSLLLAPLAPAEASDRYGGGRHGFSISLGFDAFPELVQVPGYPVYYAPRAAANYFFHDGLFWLFSDDRWYSSAWYDGPWDYVAPDYVPAFVLRVPVGYYRRPPRYFAGWHHDHAPRWGDHWGRDWSRHRSGWDRWDRHGDHRPAPLPAYQRQYAGSRYPRDLDRQRVLRVEHGRRGSHDDGHRSRGGGDGYRSRGRGSDDGFRSNGRGSDDGARSRGRGGDDDSRGRGRGGDDDGGRHGGRDRGRGDDRGRDHR